MADAYQYRGCGATDRFDWPKSPATQIRQKGQFSDLLMCSDWYEPGVLIPYAAGQQLLRAHRLLASRGGVGAVWGSKYGMRERPAITRHVFIMFTIILRYEKLIEELIEGTRVGLVFN